MHPAALTEEAIPVSSIVSLVNTSSSNVEGWTYELNDPIKKPRTRAGLVSAIHAGRLALNVPSPIPSSTRATMSIEMCCAEPMRMATTSMKHVPDSD